MTTSHFSLTATMAMYSPSVLPEDDQPPPHDQNDVDDEELPSEAQFVLLCLDHLRELRRAYPNKEDLLVAEGLDADYLSVAIYALSRAFKQPPELSNSTGNDCRLDRERANELTPNLFPVQDPKSSKNFISIPNLNSINQEIFYSNNHEEEEEYYYDDSHASNAHRFYPLDGLASGPSLRGPLTLGELAVAGLAGLGARSRLAAELDVRDSPLFDQFVTAVRSKGFFRDPDTERPRDDPEEEKERLRKAAEIEEERLAKVMGKVRTKLATKAQEQLEDHVGEIPPLYDDFLVMSAAERLERRRRHHVEHAMRVRQGDENTNGGGGRATTTQQQSNIKTTTSKRPNTDSLFRESLKSSRASHSQSPSKPLEEDTSAESHPGLHVVTSSTITSQKNNRSSSSPQKQQQRAPPPPHESPATPSATKLAISTPRSTRSAPSPQDNPADVEEAERLKAVGNTHMQRKEYRQAAEAYTDALTLSPNGPYTHVYYSNRAAALLSMKRFDQAIADSERSLALKPDYGKAHARLGLAHFLLGNYRLAVEAYTVSLKYEPDNKSTKNYLEKAAKRAAAMEKQEGGGASFSMVSELDSAKRDETAKIREREAEKLKLKGNSHMANRDYEAALMNYTAAVKLSPDGPNSHVYYSNRAAALCYLERYEEAEADSEHSLLLVPTYGKAHARLGLSRFFMGDYAGAIDAYTSALEFDPDNAASKSYLAKAKARLAKQSGGDGHHHSTPSRPSRKSSEPALMTTPVPREDDSLDEIMNTTMTPKGYATAAEI